MTPYKNNDTIIIAMFLMGIFLVNSASFVEGYFDNNEWTKRYVTQLIFTLIFVFVFAFLPVKIIPIVGQISLPQNVKDLTLLEQIDQVTSQQTPKLIYIILTGMLNILLWQILFRGSNFIIFVWCFIVIITFLGIVYFNGFSIIDIKLTFVKDKSQRSTDDRKSISLNFIHQEIMFWIRIHIVIISLLLGFLTTAITLLFHSEIISGVNEIYFSLHFSFLFIFIIFSLFLFNVKPLFRQLSMLIEIMNLDIIATNKSAVLPVNGPKSNDKESNEK